MRAIPIGAKAEWSITAAADASAKWSITAVADTQTYYVHGPIQRLAYMYVRHVFFHGCVVLNCELRCGKS